LFRSGYGERSGAAARVYDGSSVLDALVCHHQFDDFPRSVHREDQLLERCV
jgi:hypothetical protein